MTGSVAEVHQTNKAPANKNGKYLTFTLEKEEYGISIFKVKEIIGIMPVTSVPGTPDFIKGVINLRGKVISVVDLRLKFSMGSIPYSDRTCIIVVEIDAKSGTVPIGIIVDAVSEVLNIREEDTEDTPAFGASLDTDYILGMAKTRNSVKILLDIDRVLTANDSVNLKNFS